MFSKPAKILSLSFSLLILASCAERENPSPAHDVLVRTLGEEGANRFALSLDPTMEGPDGYKIASDGRQVSVRGKTEVALVRGAYDFIRQETGGMVTWAGNNVGLPEALPHADRSVTSPYQYRYYFNVVTHGYTTPYWDWARWEQEIDWMALHGINMPLIGGAHEAILDRVFQKLGLSEAESAAYFSGPAHFPWNRMGNIQGWDGPLPDGYFGKQIALTHKMLTRMRALGMSPIIHAFAGFVPEGVKRLYPDEDIRELGWGGGLPLENNAFILSPTSELFVDIGRMYIEEWEAEFGKADYYLADSFNEMDAPLPDDHQAALSELEGYGEAVYRSIHDANPDATWVMQGWTFPYHKDASGKLFWTPERLGALLSKVPDDKLLILDLANEYNRVFWKIDPSWKMYDGFFGKKWIYSFIPNMGGKTPLNGILDIYATIPAEALQYENKQNLVGFGFAPEGIENNEIIYELLSDIAWTDKPIHLEGWIAAYSKQRYGAYPDSIREAYALLNTSAYGTFTDHPMHRYQFRPYSKPEGVEDHATVHKSETFGHAVAAFLKDGDTLKGSAFYRYDAIDMVTQYLGLVADEMLLAFLDKVENGEGADLDEIAGILLTMDRLLLSHPNRKLDDWLMFARSWGDTAEEKAYYETNARRLLTTWGGDPVNDYAGRVWAGLIRDYYLPRWQTYHADMQEGRKDRMRAWEEAWINASGVSETEAFEDPIAAAQAIFASYYKPQ
ncbi:MAG: alpha-N-acetylglucosaminidase [Alphaproteobacteria bacterium]|nr:alpha-N-acetylglucosaminidase [Alphaproteobacteria bacterium]